MHVVKTHRVAHTILRCQAIIVLISLQLRLITSLEANLHLEKEPAFTGGIYNHTAMFRNENITKKSERETHLTAFLHTHLC